MSAVEFLLDQTMDPAVAAVLLAREPSINSQIVGQPDAPALGTKDSELLEYAELNSPALVTFDKRTMPGHVTERLRSGRHTFGVFIFAQSWWPPGRIADELLLVWGASSADEWIDQTVYLPL